MIYHKMMNMIFSFCLGGLVSAVIVINQDKLEQLQKLYFTIYDNLLQKEDRSLSLKVPTAVVAFFDFSLILLKLFIIRVEQHLRQNCIQTGKYYIITHIIEGKMYRLIIKPKKGPIEDYNAFHLGFDSIQSPHNEQMKELIK